MSGSMRPLHDQHSTLLVSTLEKRRTADRPSRSGFLQSSCCCCCACFLGSTPHHRPDCLLSYWDSTLLVSKIQYQGSLISISASATPTIPSVAGSLYLSIYLHIKQAGKFLPTLRTRYSCSFHWRLGTRQVDFTGSSVQV